MDWSFILECALKAVGSFAATLIVTFASILFAKLKTKIGEARLSAFIEKCVEAAEQLYPNVGTKMGPEKYQYVVDRVLERYPKLKNNAYLKALIEAAVYKLSEGADKIIQENKLEESDLLQIS